jgi:hypothetical protein
LRDFLFIFKFSSADTQVKTWYQNRRTKWKRTTSVGLELLAETGNYSALQSLYRGVSPYALAGLSALPYAISGCPPAAHMLMGGGGGGVHHQHAANAESSPSAAANPVSLSPLELYYRQVQAMAALQKQQVPPHVPPHLQHHNPAFTLSSTLNATSTLSTSSPAASPPPPPSDLSHAASSSFTAAKTSMNLSASPELTCQQQPDEALNMPPPPHPLSSYQSIQLPIKPTPVIAANQPSSPPMTI